MKFFLFIFCLKRKSEHRFDFQGLGLKIILDTFQDTDSCF